MKNEHHRFVGAMPTGSIPLGVDGVEREISAPVAPKKSLDGLIINK